MPTLTRDDVLRLLNPHVRKAHEDLGVYYDAGKTQINLRIPSDMLAAMDFFARHHNAQPIPRPLRRNIDRCTMVRNAIALWLSLQYQIRPEYFEQNPVPEICPELILTEVAS